jgi:hypothetical protein
MAKASTKKSDAKTLGVAPAAVATPAKPTLDDLLGDSVSTTPKKKSGTPDIRLTGDEVEQAIADYVQALSDKKDAEAAMADSFAVIAPEVEAKRVELSRSTKTYQSSIRVNARLTYIGPSQFCKIKLPDAANQYDGLLGLFGARAPGYYGKGYSLKVKAEAIDAETVAALKEACAKVGKAFGEVFDTEQVVSFASSLHTDRIMLPDVAALCKQAEEQGFLKPYKATLKE